jgi:hypothetical protein
LELWRANRHMGTAREASTTAASKMLRVVRQLFGVCDQ